MKAREDISGYRNDLMLMKSIRDFANGEQKSKNGGDEYWEASDKIEKEILKTSDVYIINLWAEFKENGLDNRKLWVIVGYLSAKTENIDKSVKINDINIDLVSAMVAEKFMANKFVTILFGVLAISIVILLGGTFTIGQQTMSATDQMARKLDEYNTRVAANIENIENKSKETLTNLTGKQDSANLDIVKKVESFETDLEKKKKDATATILRDISKKSEIDAINKNISSENDRIKDIKYRIDSISSAIPEDLYENRIKNIVEKIDKIEDMLQDIYNEADEGKSVCVENHRSRICYIVQVFLSANNHLAVQNFDGTGSSSTTEAIKSYWKTRGQQDKGILTLDEAKKLLADEVRKASGSSNYPIISTSR